jgi:hypothetical protein
LKIEHITLGGNSVMRDTADILETTKRVFEIVSMDYKSQLLHIPKLPFQIKITATKEGAAFDIQKNGNPVVTNLCCFEEKYSALVLAQVFSLADMFKKVGIVYSVVEPVTPKWLYSTVVNPLVLTPDNMMIAGEIELYVFEQLYLAYRRTKF